MDTKKHENKCQCSEDLIVVKRPSIWIYHDIEKNMPFRNREFNIRSLTLKIVTQYSA